MQASQRVGEVGFDYTAASPHTVVDGSGFYNGHHYDWDRLISPALSDHDWFRHVSLLLESEDAGCKLGGSRSSDALRWSLDRTVQDGLVDLVINNQLAATTCISAAS